MIKPYRVQNESETYAIVDGQGNILEKFRLKQTAIGKVGYYKRLNTTNNIRIISLKLNGREKWRKEKGVLKDE